MAGRGERQTAHAVALRSLHHICGPRQDYRMVLLASEDAIDTGTLHRSGRVFTCRTPGLSTLLKAPLGVSRVAMCDADGLATLRRAGITGEDLPIVASQLLSETPKVLPRPHLRDIAEPFFVEVSSAAGNGIDPNAGDPVTVEMGCGTDRRMALHVANLQELDTGAGPRSGRKQRFALRIPLGVSGPLACASVLMSIDLFLYRHLQRSKRQSLLIRVDYAGLGMTRREYRELERQLSQLLTAYGQRTGKAAILVGELGFVRGYTDANVVLEPYTACRLDLTVPENRSSPIFLNLVQQIPSTGRGPISIGLESPDGNIKELRLEANGESVEHLSGFGKICAVIAPPVTQDDGRNGCTHVIAFAPTMGEGAFARCPGQPGEWEVTVTNTGTSDVAMQFFLEDPMPLLPHWQSPRATIRRSRSQAWDPEMLDFVRPDFYDLRSRFDALVRHADYVPPLVIRRQADSITWPLVNVIWNTHLSRMAFNRSTGVAEPLAADDRQPGTGEVLTPFVPLQEVKDTLIERCLEALRDCAPEDVEKTIAATLEAAAI